MRSVTVGLVLAALAGPVLGGGATPVAVADLRYEARAQAVRASGPVRPVSEQALGFKVGGILEALAVREGQVVARGDLIARLDPEALQAQVARAESLVADARRQRQRYQRLEQRRLAADEQLRQAETALEVAESDLRIARFNLRHAEIRAPADGRVLARRVEENEPVQAGQPVVVFADASRGWEVTLNVADVDVVRLRLGDPARVQLDAYPDQPFAGVVSEIAGRADPASQTFTVEVALRQPPPLYSGLVAHARIAPTRTRSLAALPLSALVQARGSHGRVYVLDATDHARPAEVEIAYLEGEGALIRPGLAEGVRVVTRGGPFLYDGAPVQVVP